ncbi:FRG domain-containing protein [bacterium]|nr:FRG domain-containing protein [bacterium]
MTASITTHRVRTWSEFVALVESPSLDGWAFRGQRDSAWPLECRLSRYFRQFVGDREVWIEQEQRGIRIFRRKAHHFLDEADELSDTFRCLAVMQHHGAPTRLLDFTKSPYVACFFALERAEGEAAVWAINTPELLEVGPALAPGLTRDRVHPQRDGNLERYFLSGEHCIVWAGEPYEMNRRLIAQSGTFVVPGVIDRPVETILAEAYPEPARLLRKIVLDAPGVRTDAMRALYRMNITNATLFPDLDGLARSIALELEMRWRAQGGRR